MDRRGFLKRVGWIGGAAAVGALSPAMLRGQGRGAKARPDVLFIPDYYNKVGLIAKQVRQLGIDAVLLGGDGWDSPEMLKIGGEAIHGAYFTNHYSPDDPRPEVQDWVKDYRDEHGQLPDAMATLGHDAALLLLEAVRNADKPEREDIRAALAGIEGFPCVSGEVSFDEWGNPIKSAVVLQYTPEGQRYVATVTP